MGGCTHVSRAFQPERPALPAILKKISAACLCPFMLIGMNEHMIDSFYRACPVWFWPVLWAQIILMDARLAQLHARAGEDVDYCIALGPYGTLHILPLSDGSAGLRNPDHWKHRSAITAAELACEDVPDWFWHNLILVCVSAAFAILMAAATQTPAYLDPG